MKTHKKGQTLTALLVFMVIAITIAVAGATLMSINLANIQRIEQGTTTFQAAESGAENALIRLLRDPNYPGETLTVGTATVTITVTGNPNKTILSRAEDGNFVRKIQINTTYVNSILSISSWKEVY